jgi:two-component system, LytTR family, response regulator AlgR
MTVLRTLVVDDEPLAVERLLSLCSARNDVEVIGAASNGQTAMSLIAALKPDLLLLDINMPEMDGMAVARQLSTQAEAGSAVPAVIFITAHSDFALEAFDIAAVDYLLKPVSGERFGRALERATAKVGGDAVTENAEPYALEFWVPHRSDLVRIASSQIDRVEAERDYMRLHVGERSYLLHQTITILETRLDPEQFIRIHRSSIVRRGHIMRLGHDGAGSWHAELHDGTTLRVGRTYLSAVKSLAGR